LTQLVERGLMGQDRNDHFDLHDAVVRITQAQGFALTVLRRPEKRTNARSLFQLIKKLERRLNAIRDRFRAVGAHAFAERRRRLGFVERRRTSQCSPPAPRSGTMPRAPSSPARISEPDRSHRSYSLSTPRSPRACCANVVSDTAASTSTKPLNLRDSSAKT